MGQDQATSVAPPPTAATTTRVPGAATPGDRVRLVPTALDRRIPYTRAELRGIFNDDSLRAKHFSNLDLGDAIKLREAVHVRQQAGAHLHVDDFAMCEPLLCEDDPRTFLPSRDPLNQPHIPAPDPFHSEFVKRVACPNQAIWLNLLADPAAHGTYERSLCREFSADCGYPSHTGSRHRFTCTSCKDKRYRDRVWRQRQLWFGICLSCTKWAAANVRNLEACECEPMGSWPKGVKGNELRTPNLCRQHDWLYWTEARYSARLEIHARRTMRFKKKAAYVGYKRPKPTPRSQLTPRQRRWQMTGGGKLSDTPRCYCGNRLEEADHVRPNGATHMAGGVLVPTMQ
ncbi:hypothetical protein LTR53_003342 [Teratosphaeriaceae sp. CCFEE 6253]|nr:hypothetical protein LTR53_003342 [Teratosphaeriaceae sp. CCFEE 6253]